MDSLWKVMEAVAQASILLACLGMTLLHTCRLLARKAGVEIHRYNAVESQQARLFKLLAGHGINLVLDVGANDGGYGRLLRAGGYQGEIISFEPLEKMHRALTVVSDGDARWHVAPRMALGAEDGEVEFNVAQNTTSSSVLPILELHTQAAPESQYVAVEKVPLRRLDRVNHPALRRECTLLLKVDTQGYEMQVLHGAEGLLPMIRGVQLELSLTPLYAGQSLYREIIDWLALRGFELWNVIPGFVNPDTGRLLQFDGVFFRNG